MSHWRPSASIDTLVARADLLHNLRCFFASRCILEVDTPLLCRASITDPSIEVFSVRTQSNNNPECRFLQTSPEYAMKRLLAAGIGDIFQISKSFRKGEFGRNHNPEFTVLEWYRTNWDHNSLIREVAELLCQILDQTGWQVWPYRVLFQELLDFDPLGPKSQLSDLLNLATHHIQELPDELDTDGVLDLLMTHCIEPRIREWGIVFITDFPASQASLSKTYTKLGVEVAARFECYVNGLELANGYFEQTEAGILKERFQRDIEKRSQRGLSQLDMDRSMLSAHESGLPECSGVAMGVDRLLAIKLNLDDLSETLSFDWSRA